MGKQSSTSKNIYGKTTTSNPYALASTNNSGTTANLKSGTALDTIYNYVNNNIGSLLDDYLNPNLDSATNQAKLNAFRNNLNAETSKSLQNNIINPLSNRNMLRSSQATDLYKNLSNANTDAVSNYVNTLLADSQNNSASMLNNLLSAYMNGYNVVADTQNQSLNTSQGNATNKNTTTSFNISQVAQLINSLSKFI